MVDHVSGGPPASGIPDHSRDWRGPPGLEGVLISTGGADAADVCLGGGVVCGWCLSLCCGGGGAVGVVIDFRNFLFVFYY